MSSWLKGVLIFVASGVAVFSASGVGQRRQSSPIKNAALQQNGSRRLAQSAGGTREQLQTRAKKILEDEASREAGACKEAKTTAESNACFAEQAGLAEKNLKALEDVIAQLGDPSPQDLQSPDHPVETGLSGPVLSPKQHVAEFRKVEQSWRQYRVAACTAAFHQFDGGTGGPSFELQCEMKLDRSHMRELDMIYGGDLHL